MEKESKVGLIILGILATGIIAYFFRCKLFGIDCPPPPEPPPEETIDIINVGIGY